MDAVVAPVVRELSRLEKTVRSRMDADNELVAGLEAELAALRAEVTGLRMAVAHLRCSAGPVPAVLRPVVARAVLAARETSGAWAHRAARPARSPG